MRVARSLGCGWYRSSPSQVHIAWIVSRGYFGMRVVRSLFAAVLITDAVISLRAILYEALLR